MRLRTLAAAAALMFGCGLALAPSAYAQGRGHGHEHGREHEHDRDDEDGDRMPPGQAKKRVVTMDRATVVTREVLVAHGYDVVRVEVIRGAQVVYYRRGNHGRGWGRGPVEKMVIRPEPDRVIFESAPPRVLVDINVRLGM